MFTFSVSFIKRFSRNTDLLIDSQLTKNYYLQKTGIYRIPLVKDNRTKYYIGRTIRGLGIRIKEHINDIEKFNVKNSALAFESVANNWRPKFNEARVFVNCESISRSVFLENLFIKLTENVNINYYHMEEIFDKNWRKLINSDEAYKVLTKAIT